ncbi:hypothetical protein CNMCM5793_001767 [Aspergillus hiratsukae]|uniref:Fe2OG dioxygenase domain-containing protein n=1 Tax=Aspergillus hiratsukae TaxID=1194566 RepID=A0A8H6PBU3_9EURO|nr:hypothetical protein CNMCM5793_001767 [Aspergillus hiratsukae]
MEKTQPQQTRALFPAIDFAQFQQGNDPEARELLKQYGAFRLRNHGISIHAKDNCFAFARTFFSQSDDLKSKVPSFSGFEREKVRGSPIPKESLYVSKDDLQTYPAVQALYNDIDRIIPDLLRALSTTLDLPFSLDEYHVNSDDEVALHHYPTIAGVERTRNRNPAHRDFGLLTLLIQEDTEGNNGLEVADLDSTAQRGSAVGSSARFTPVEPGENEITVMLGNMLPKMAKGKGCEGVRACVHRVAAGEGERYSIACFIHADGRTVLDNEGTTAGEHREQWVSRSQVLDHSMSCTPDEDRIVSMTVARGYEDEEDLPVIRSLDAIQAPNAVDDVALLG